MGAYKYLMIHCTATIAGTNVLPETIERWHMGARDLPNGNVRFKGKTYKNRSQLPYEKVGGILAKNSSGRGWDRVGYSKLFTESGIVHTLKEHNEDNWISAKEITYGAVGFNSVTKHFVYAGGLAKKKINGKHPFMNTMTTSQEYELINAVKQEISKNANLKIIGHNQVAVKGCPCFDVRAWCQHYGISIDNIDTRPVLVDLPNDQLIFINPNNPFQSKKEGDAFRNWINDNHPEYARIIDLDRSGSFENKYILRAWKDHGEEYARL